MSDRRCRILHWNVNGLRAVASKGFIESVVALQPDVICLQETKVGLHQIPAEILEWAHDRYEIFLSEATKPGYSGVATFVHRSFAPISVVCDKDLSINPRFMSEGRFLVSDHGRFLLYNVYFPSGTTGDERQIFKYDFLAAFFAHLQSLPEESKRRLIICGDVNICHQPNDIHHPDIAHKRRLSGFLPDERKWLDQLIGFGFIDAFRHCHPDERNRYTWWTYRSGARQKNLGWRIDYFFISNELLSNLVRADIHEGVLGSDHCPITIDLTWE